MLGSFILMCNIILALSLLYLCILAAQLRPSIHVHDLYYCPVVGVGGVGGDGLHMSRQKLYAQDPCCCLNYKNGGIRRFSAIDILLRFNIVGNIVLSSCVSKVQCHDQKTKQMKATKVKQSKVVGNEYPIYNPDR